MSAYKCSSPGNDLEELKKVWYAKLKEVGFVDIEDDRQNLKAHNTRTIAFENRDIILDFFLRLDAYLLETKDIPDIHRLILELYSKGEKIKRIAFTVRMTRQSIHKIINRYKGVINGSTFQVHN